jgi:hypothetical protein
LGFKNDGYDYSQHLKEIGSSLLLFFGPHDRVQVVGVISAKMEK